jgi:predicted class III extradiol MEMO1 family dioxygenase
LISPEKSTEAEVEPFIIELLKPFVLMSSISVKVLPTVTVVDDNDVVERASEMLADASREASRESSLIELSETSTSIPG